MHNFRRQHKRTRNKDATVHRCLDYSTANDGFYKYKCVFILKLNLNLYPCMDDNHMKDKILNIKRESGSHTEIPRKLMLI